MNPSGSGNSSSTKPLVVFEDPLAVVGDKHHLGFEEYLGERKLEPTIALRNGQVCRFFSKGFCVAGTRCPHRHRELFL